MRCERLPPRQRVRDLPDRENGVGCVGFFHLVLVPIRPVVQCGQSNEFRGWRVQIALTRLRNNMRRRSIPDRFGKYLMRVPLQIDRGTSREVNDGGRQPRQDCHASRPSVNATTEPARTLYQSMPTGRWPTASSKNAPLAKRNQHSVSVA